MIRDFKTFMRLEAISKIRLEFREQVELSEIPPSGARNGEKAEHTRSM
jgi:hypothetical protein